MRPISRWEVSLQDQNVTLPQRPCERQPWETGLERKRAKHRSLGITLETSAEASKITKPVYSSGRASLMGIIFRKEEPKEDGI